MSIINPLTGKSELWTRSSQTKKEMHVNMITVVHYLQAHFFLLCSLCIFSRRHFIVILLISWHALFLNYKTVPHLRDV
jgi:hypothetical protein